MVDFFFSEKIILTLKWRDGVKNEYYKRKIAIWGKLKTKQKGRNQDINVKEMDNYREMKKKLEQERKKLENANKQTKKIDNSSKDIVELLDNLKTMPFSKNNSQI